MEGIEPTTPRLQITCSGQLSYIGIAFSERDCKYRDYFPFSKTFLPFYSSFVLFFVSASFYCLFHSFGNAQHGLFRSAVVTVSAVAATNAVVATNAVAAVQGRFSRMLSLWNVLSHRYLSHIPSAAPPELHSL